MSTCYILFLLKNGWCFLNTEDLRHSLLLKSVNFLVIYYLCNSKCQFYLFYLFKTSTYKDILCLALIELPSLYRISPSKSSNMELTSVSFSCSPGRWGKVGMSLQTFFFIIAISILCNNNNLFLEITLLLAFWKLLKTKLIQEVYKNEWPYCPSCIILELCFYYTSDCSIPWLPREI